MLTSRQNPLVRRLRKLGTDSGYRRETGEFLCDGEKMLRDAIAAGAPVSKIITSSRTLADKYSGFDTESATRDILSYISPLKTAQELLFSCKLPETLSVSELPPKSILLENIRDPGNVGTIIRTANALGAPLVGLIGDCADPYGAKAARASMGALFRQKIAGFSLEDIKRSAESGTKILGAALSGASLSIHETSFENTSVIIGNEGNGLSSKIVLYCSGTFVIPMKAGTDSLNAASAAAIIMWEMLR